MERKVGQPAYYTGLHGLHDACYQVCAGCVLWEARKSNRGTSHEPVESRECTEGFAGGKSFQLGDYYEAALSYLA